MIVLGSGGHTAEMLALVAHMDKQRYSPRCYVVSRTDAMGAHKALTAEQDFASSSLSPISGAAAKVARIPRSREVGQSYLTSIWTTLVAIWAALAMVWREKPQLVLVNGPGTCIPICVAAFLFRYLARQQSRIVYVESIARVFSLSLSGKILYRLRLADAVFVQWPELQQRYSRCQYKGRLF
eukprot:jgi/Astpho2/8949/fgenesh1_pm.00133_%23_13_t